MPTSVTQLRERGDGSIAYFSYPTFLPAPTATSHPVVSLYINSLRPDGGLQVRGEGRTPLLSRERAISEADPLVSQDVTDHKYTIKDVQIPGLKRAQINTWISHVDDSEKEMNANLHFIHLKSTF